MLLLFYASPQLVFDSVRWAFVGVGRISISLTFSKLDVPRQHSTVLDGVQHPDGVLLVVFRPQK
ncbi:hypothetical protein TorRG33x02_149260 [Trema orientale]|uniref:Uncharacterized protein n=1 Tax=Trema orientale TaxID=63057 RepID=A0A2P5EUQ3_TREOI|nr:hypothetical protein TorRG33x02_149260 [Trema orientale]